MRRYLPHSGREHEQGIIISIVAIFMLFVMGAMAALSIDLVTLYTARSEAQLAADAAALAGARVLANSGATSDTTGTTMSAAWANLAKVVALAVAKQNQVAGSNLTDSEISFPNPPPNGTNPISNPTVTVRIQVTSLPVFFSRIWGTTALVVTVSATAEAYNPSGLAGTSALPVAPTCVKPWLLPNLDPTQLTTVPIFAPATGAINNSALLGHGWPSATNLNGLFSGDPNTDAPVAGVYYPGSIDAADFPAPTKALPACSTFFKPYQLAVAGCVPRPIPCGSTANASIGIDPGPYAANTLNRDTDTVQAAECLTHYNGVALDSDSLVNAAGLPPPPFQFQAGNQNPVAGAVGKVVMVSDSLVTVPVYDSSGGGAPGSGPVTVIGFLQLFLNPQAAGMPATQIPVSIINMVGCGTNAAGTPVNGNGGSPVAVRLITPP